MCGICGIKYNETSRSVSKPLLETMTAKMAHRGPDDQGCYIDGSTGLGFRRLSIIDIVGSPQPMSNENDMVWLVFNGEIYNFQDLRERLISDHQFSTQGDTETIIHGYETYGSRCVDFLRGMFSFAIWDKKLNQLFLAVDRFGKKPLYYLHDDKRFIFASELKSILEHPDIPRDIDPIALDEYLSYGYISAPRTIFKSIRKVCPGHTLTLDSEFRLHTEQYWHPSLGEAATYDNRSLDELAEELRYRLEEAVKIRMISDVPIGAFLSGGIDSSIVVALMSKASSRPVKTFSIGFEEEAFDESPYAQIVADHYQTDHSRDIVKPDVVALLPKLIEQFDEPFADASMIPTYVVSEVARKYVTVALSGDGGDEIFGGYYTYRYGFRHKLLQNFIPQPLRPLTAKVSKQVPALGKLQRYLSVVDQPIHHWILDTPYFGFEQRALLYADKHNSYLGQSEDMRQQFLDNYSKLEWLSQFQQLDLTHYMPGDILVKVDRTSMLSSLEVRSPLLDHELFEFMAKVPPEYKMNQASNKILLKQATKDLLPDNILQRKKHGFTVPIAEWLRKPLANMVQDTLLSPEAKMNSFFDTSYIKSLVEDHLSGKSNHDFRLWNLLCLELWAGQYL